MDIPPAAHLLKPVSELDYYDVRSISIPVDITPLEAWNLLTSEQGIMMSLAFRVRDAISSLFGVKTIRGFSGIQREMTKSGDRLDFFLVEYVSPEMLVLTARDRHLDVMLCISVINRILTMTSSVVTHNAFGRIYMVPVGPAHRFIAKNDLMRLKRQLENSTPISIPHK